MIYNMTYEVLSSLFTNKDAKICIIGLGQVGLLTALTFCKSGFQVFGNDVNEELLDSLKSKKSLLNEEGLDELLVSCVDSGKFHTTPDIVFAVEQSNVIIICVATPVTQDIKPDLTALTHVCESLSNIVLKNKLIIVESSIPPGTFSELIIPLLTKNVNSKSDFWVSFVPERFSPGQGLKEIQSTPRLIGVIDDDSGNLTKSLYQNIVQSEILLTSVKIAEMSKLVENTFRDVNVAFANEIGMMCEEYGIDVKELIKVCNSHPRVNLLNPGPGVGGPCLPKDPYLLLHPQNGQEFNSELITYSRKINDHMPNHVVKLLLSALNKINKKIKNATVLVLGTTYKANVSDTRLSPSKEIISQLIKNGANVLVFDPLTSETFGGTKLTQIFESDLIYDAIVILTDHEEFKKLNLRKIKDSMNNDPIIVDTKRIFNKNEVEELGIRYVAVGYVKQT